MATQFTKFPEGAYTVLVTPFKEDQTIDYEDLDRLVDAQLESSITGIVLLGTTSESPTVRRSEKEEMVQHIYERVAGRKFVVVGVGGNDTTDTTDFATFCEQYCDGLMTTVPCYNKPSQEGIYRHFVTVGQAVPNKPIMMYNIPSRTGVNMLPETMARINKTVPNCCAVKESTGDLNQAQDIAVLCPSIHIFSGDDALTVPIMSIGGRGVVSVAGSAIPDEVSEVVGACLRGDYTTARALHYSMRDFLKYLFVETNPGPIKEVLNQTRVFKTSVMRLPMVPMQDEDKKTRLMELYAGVRKQV